MKPRIVRQFGMWVCGIEWTDTYPGDTPAEAYALWRALGAPLNWPDDYRV